MAVNDKKVSQEFFTFVCSYVVLNHFNVCNMDSKRTLYYELCSSVKAALREKHSDAEMNYLNNETTNHLCCVIEALFIHGLRPKYVIRNSHRKYPEPNFWPFISKYLHRNVRAQIKNLNQINTDIGRSRVWVRLALIDGVVDNYLSIFIANKDVLRHYYADDALIRDEKLRDSTSHHLRALMKFSFNLALNSSLLNIWIPSPLKLAGLLVDGGSTLRQISADDGDPERQNTIEHCSLEEDNSDDLSLDHTCTMDDLYSASAVSSLTTSAALLSGMSSDEFLLGFSQFGDKIMSKLEPAFTAFSDSQRSGNVLNCKTPNVSVSYIEMSLPENGKTDQSPVVEFELSPTKEDSLDPNSVEWYVAENDCSSSYTGEIGDGALADLQADFHRIGFESCEAEPFVIERPDRASCEASYLVPNPDDVFEIFEIHPTDAQKPPLNEYCIMSTGSEEEQKLCASFDIPGSLNDSSASGAWKFLNLAVREQNKWQYACLTKIATEKGLDVQSGKCHSCARCIGFTNEPFKVCNFDGYYYCSACHVDDTMLIPARALLNWDFTPRKVSRASKAFLVSIYDQPIFHMNEINPALLVKSKALSQLHDLRLELNYIAAYLLTCRKSVAEELSKRLWPKDYLFKVIDLYSLVDLEQTASGKLHKLLKPVFEYAVNHVLHSCRLCSQKGFICEICNSADVIYPFELQKAFRCPKCAWVFHKACMEGKSCTKCLRREALAVNANANSIDLSSTLPFDDL
ncbi:Pleckstrin homology domain-containing family M member 3 [Trichinella murrelli]|uniref:Pleckstrin homology domain-containing family M member 3 n=1 Tax=Trichinella murrelli TaxID=144512 RepID=A0A0V0TTY9_9BILA|nr:Pleckstrin homology domain-containing family M member 3 [Trichinella murrelli]